MKDSEKTGIMEFNEKLQELRKQKALTQEELAEVLFVPLMSIAGAGELMPGTCTWGDGF